MGLVSDTASAQVIQIVKMDVSPDIIPTKIDKNFKFNYPNYSRSTLFEPPCNSLITNLKNRIVLYNTSMSNKK